MNAPQLGEILLASKVINRDQLDEGLRYMREYGLRLGQALVFNKICSEDDIANALARQFGLDRVDLTNFMIDPKLMFRVGKRNVERFHIIPLDARSENGVDVLTVATAHPENLILFDDLKAALGMTVEAKVAVESAIGSLLEQIVGYDTTQSVRNMTELHVAFNQFARGDSQSMLVKEGRRPKLLDKLAGVSQAHVQTLEQYRPVEMDDMERFLVTTLIGDQMEHCRRMGGISLNYSFQSVGRFQISVENSCNPDDDTITESKASTYQIRIERLSAYTN